MKFGLNQKVKLTNFECQESKGSYRLRLDFDIPSGKFVNKRHAIIFYPDYILGRNGTKITSGEELTKAQSAVRKYAFDVAAAFIGSEEVTYRFSEKSPKPATFKEFCEFYKSCLPANYNDIELDLFVNYEYSFGKNKEGVKNEVTYLTIPNEKAAKHGVWITRHIPGNFEERYEKYEGKKAYKEGNNWKDTDEFARYKKQDVVLEYVDMSNGVQHPFTRGGYFMSSNYARQQGTKTVKEGSDAPKQVNKFDYLEKALQELSNKDEFHADYETLLEVVSTYPNVTQQFAYLLTKGTPAGDISKFVNLFYSGGDSKEESGAADDTLPF